MVPLLDQCELRGAGLRLALGADWERSPESVCALARRDTTHVLRCWYAAGWSRACQPCRPAVRNESQYLTIIIITCHYHTLSRLYTSYKNRYQRPRAS